MDIERERGSKKERKEERKKSREKEREPEARGAAPDRMLVWHAASRQ